MNTAPSANGSNGRHQNGQFAPGNRGGPGNPHGRKTSELRAMLLASVSDADFRAVVRKLVTLAKRGDIHAIRELFDRMLGRPARAVDNEPVDEWSPTNREEKIRALQRRLGIEPVDDYEPPEFDAREIIAKLSADEKKVLNKMHRLRMGIDGDEPKADDSERIDEPANGHAGAESPNRRESAGRAVVKRGPNSCSP